MTSVARPSMADVGTLTLTEFILARISEDEAVASAFPEYGIHWTDDGDYGHGAVEATDGDQPYDIGTVVYDEGRPTEAQAAHIVRWDPARVLAECGAKRQLVSIHEARQEDPYGEITDRVVWWCQECDHDRDYTGIPHEEEGCPTLRLLALPYADHPSYDEAWKP